MSREPDDRTRMRRAHLPHPRAIVCALLSAGLSASFVVTIVLPIQSELPTLLNAPAADTTWVVTATLLSSAVATPVTGKLGDMYGRRRVLLTLVLLQFIGAVIAAASSSVAPLVVGRALQGLAVGVIPLGIAIMRDELPRERLGPAIGMMSATIGVGGALGLPLAGFVAQHLDWHALFWISGALAAASFVLVRRFVRPSTARSAGRLDLVGAIALTGGLSCLLVALTRGDAAGWLSPATLATGGTGAALLLAWCGWELRTPNPIADLHLASRPGVMLTNLASAALSFSLFTGNIVYPQLLSAPADESGAGLSSDATGAVMLSQSLAIVVASPIAGRALQTVGPKLLLATGGLLAAVAYGLSLHSGASIWAVLVAGALLGIAAGTAFAAMPTLIMVAVPVAQTGAANGLNALMRSVGNAFSSAVMGTILASQVAAPTGEAFRLCFTLALIAGTVGLALALVMPDAGG